MWVWQILRHHKTGVEAVAFLERFVLLMWTGCGRGGFVPHVT